LERILEAGKALLRWLITRPVVTAISEDFYTPPVCWLNLAADAFWTLTLELIKDKLVPCLDSYNCFGFCE